MGPRGVATRAGRNHGPLITFPPTPTPRALHLLPAHRRTVHTVGHGRLPHVQWQGGPDQGSLGRVAGSSRTT
jgi:hypothetical protein